MSTKIETKSLTEIVADLESAASAKAEQDRAAADAAAEAYHVYQESAETAELSEDEILSRWSGGESEPTALDLITARAEIERSTLLRDAANRAWKRHIASLPVDSAVAEHLAPVLSAMLPNAEVVSTFIDPRQVSGFEPAGRAGVVVAQTENHSVSRHGSLSADLVIHYLRAPEHSQFDADRLTDLAREREIALSVKSTSTQHRGHMEIDVVRVKVNQSFGPVPTFAKVDQTIAKSVSFTFAQGVADQISKLGGPATEPRRERDENGGYSIFNGKWFTAASKGQQCEIEENGIDRVVTVRDVIELSFEPSADRPERVTEAIQHVRHSMTGRVRPGVGALETFEVHTASIDNPGNSGMRVEFTARFTSAVPCVS